MKVKPSSAGAIGFSNENNRDCTVRAAANATGKAYSEIHALLKKFGRPNGKGAQILTIAKAYFELGFKLEGVFGTTTSALNEKRILSNLIGKTNVPHYRGLTFKRFLDGNLKGSFVCINRNHAFAVVDGKLIDTGAIAEGTYITCIFKLA